MDKKILWVDDQPNTIVYEIDELIDKGVDVTQKTSIDNAALAIATEKFDLIILDQRLKSEISNDWIESDYLWAGCILLRYLRKNKEELDAPKIVNNKLKELLSNDVLSNHQNNECKVIYISAFNDTSVKDAIRSSSALDYNITVIAKPIDINKFLKYVGIN